MTTVPRLVPALRATSLAAVLSLGLLLTACPGAGGAGVGPVVGGSGASAGGSARPTDRLILGIQQEPDKLNPAINAMVYGTYIARTICPFLVNFDETMELVPYVIEHVPTVENGGISEDFLTYTYVLREGIRWHDGAPFTAEDVVFSTDVILDERHEIESRTGYDKIESVTATDERTVVVKLTEPYAPFVDTYFFAFPIMPKHLLESAVGHEFSKAAWQRAPIGVGPYKFEEWQAGSHVTVVRNEDFFGGAPAIERITFRFIKDAQTMLVALEAGELDGYDNAAPDHVERLNALEGVTVSVTPALMWEHLDLNHEDPILADVRVRQAINLAVDREEIGREIYGGIWPAAYGDVRPDLRWWNPEVEKLVRLDRDAARKLLEQAGWKAGDDGIREKDGARLTLSISTTAGRKQRELTEQVLRQHLRQVGIDLTIENHNATAFFAPYRSSGVLKTGKFQLGMYAWITSPDPNRAQLYHSSNMPDRGGQNHPRMRNARLDELLDRGLRTLGFAERKAIYDEIQVIIATEVPMVPLVWRADIDPMTTRLKGYKPNPTQTGDTWNTEEWTLSE